MADRSTVMAVSKLANLEFSEEKLDSFAEQFQKIVKFVEQINELDTENIPPTTHPLEMSNVFRRDEVVESEEKDDALENAPERNGRFIVVPKVIE